MGSEALFQIRVGIGGWIEFLAGKMTRSAFARAEDHDGRLKLVDLFVQGDGGLDSNSLKSIPIGRLEAWINEPDLSRRIRSRLTGRGPDLRTTVSYYDTTFGSRAKQTWVTEMLRDPTVELNPTKALESDDANSKRSAKLRRPSARKGLDDSFYERVADTYAAQIRAGRRDPSRTIAEEAGVSPQTAYRWVAEARKRGHLAPAQQGKAG